MFDISALKGLYCKPEMQATLPPSLEQVGKGAGGFDVCVCRGKKQLRNRSELTHLFLNESIEQLQTHSLLTNAGLCSLFKMMAFNWFKNQTIIKDIFLHVIEIETDSVCLN